MGDSYNCYKGNAVRKKRTNGLRRTPMPASSKNPIQVGVQKNLKNKDLIGIPWMLAFALRTDGW